MGRGTRRCAVRAGARLLAALMLWPASGLAPPASAQDGPRAAVRDAWDGERAFAGIERLENEIALLRGLAGAQAALLAWNRSRKASGAGPAVLPARLCEAAALAPWCRALPATFGADAADAGEGGDGDR